MSRATPYKQSACVIAKKSALRLMNFTTPQRADVDSATNLINCNPVQHLRQPQRIPAAGQRVRQAGLTDARLRSRICHANTIHQHQRCAYLCWAVAQAG